LHLFTPEQLLNALQKNQVQIITWQAAFAMALLHEKFV